jgi:hypothetical protein
MNFTNTDFNVGRGGFIEGQAVSSPGSTFVQHTTNLNITTASTISIWVKLMQPGTSTISTVFAIGDSPNSPTYYDAIYYDSTVG